jgi:4-oxalocrotonate tautomerase
MRSTSGPAYGKEDVWINLVDDAGEDWSFGNGEMQYAPK